MEPRSKSKLFVTKWKIRKFIRIPTYKLTFYLPMLHIIIIFLQNPNPNLDHYILYKRHLISAHRSVGRSNGSTRWRPHQHTSQKGSLNVVSLFAHHSIARPALLLGAPVRANLARNGRRDEEIPPNRSWERNTQLLLTCCHELRGWWGTLPGCRPPPNKIRAALRKATPKRCKERATSTSKCGSVGKGNKQEPNAMEGRPAPTSLFHKTLSLIDLGRWVLKLVGTYLSTYLST